jgi:hypothetical protein
VSWTSLGRQWAELHAKIDKTYTDKAEQLAKGLAATHEEYRERVGYLNALRDLAAWQAEIEHSLDAKPPKRDA